MVQAPGTGALRTARGLVCAGVCLLLGCIAHARAQGQLPGPGSLAIAFGPLAVVCVGLAHRQRGFGFIAAVLGGAQVFLHFGFAFVTAYAAAGRGPVSADRQVLLDHHHAVPPMPDSVVGSMPATHDWLHGLTWGMAIAHVAATLGSAACLAYGERVV